MEELLRGLFSGDDLLTVVNNLDLPIFEVPMTAIRMGGDGCSILKTLSAVKVFQVFALPVGA